MNIELGSAQLGGINQGNLPKADFWTRFVRAVLPDKATSSFQTQLILFFWKVKLFLILKLFFISCCYFKTFFPCSLPYSSVKLWLPWESRLKMSKSSWMLSTRRAVPRIYIKVSVRRYFDTGGGNSYRDFMDNWLCFSFSESFSTSVGFF